MQSLLNELKNLPAPQRFTQEPQAFYNLKKAET
jgi:hypothetical protein